MMKNFNKKALALATVAILATGLSSQAHAGAKTYSHLLIDNFQIFNGNDVQYDAGDFDDLQIGNFSTTFAKTNNNGEAINDSIAGGNLDTTAGGGNADDNASCVGAGCSYEDSYMMQASPAGSSCMRGDTELLGSLVTGNGPASSVTANAVTEGQTEVTDAGSGNADVGTGTQFSFTGIDDTIRFEFDAQAMLQALLHQDDVVAFAALGFSINIFDNTNGVDFFSFSPPSLNQARTQLSTGSTGYDSGFLHFSETSAQLLAANTYTLSINQTTRGRFIAIKPIPEPATLAIFGLALMGLASTRRSKT
jgi:hypothetical protein